MTKYLNKYFSRLNLIEVSIFFQKVILIKIRFIVSTPDNRTSILYFKIFLIN